MVHLPEHHPGPPCQTLAARLRIVVIVRNAVGTKPTPYVRVMAGSLNSLE